MALSDWLAARGLTFIRFYVDREALAEAYMCAGDPPNYCILGGIGPRKSADGKDKWHAVVGNAWGYGIKIVHDPHPSRAGLVDHGKRWVTFIVKKT